GGAGLRLARGAGASCVAIENVGLERSRSSRTSRAPHLLPELSGTVSLGDERLLPTRLGLSIRAVERLLASRGSPASKRSWVRTSLLLWTVGAAPAGRVLCDELERPLRRDRTHAPAQRQKSRARRLKASEFLHRNDSGSQRARLPGVRRASAPVRGCRTNQTACTNLTMAEFADVVRAAQSARTGPSRPKWFTPKPSPCGKPTKSRPRRWFVRHRPGRLAPLPLR